MTYFIQMPHTKEECLRALDEQLAKGPDVLSKVFYGCKSGDHTGYAIVDAASEKDARKTIPEFLTGTSRIVEVGLVTPEAIRAYHSKAA